LLKSILLGEANKLKGAHHMSQKRDKGYSQQGKPDADNVKQQIAAEDLEKAIHPTKRQNSQQ
jgi:hypothetical protein